MDKPIINCVLVRDNNENQEYYENEEDLVNRYNNRYVVKEKVKWPEPIIMDEPIIALQYRSSPQFYSSTTGQPINPFVYSNNSRLRR